MWEFIEIIDSSQDEISGKIRVRVLVSDGVNTEAAPFSFPEQPTEEQIITVTQRYCENKNNPINPAEA